MLLLLLLSSLIAMAGCKVRCGGVLTASIGILQTPGFPDTIPTPLHCEWVIEAQNFATPSSNTSIVVYLTQLYVHEGLSFTEYQVYDKTYQIDGRTLHKVNETNVAQVRWVQSFQNYLVINLDLENKDSAHLRVLDRFLDVYGFNITYEIAANKGVRDEPCTMMDCGFTGICYDHFTKFSCECFPGYSGAHCSSGPNSLCTINGEPTCKNGATCIHVGVSAVKCLCTENFSGESCEKLKIQRTSKYCDNCVNTCSFNGKLENSCWCSKEMGKNVYNDRMGYTATIHFSNLPNLKGDLLKSFIEIQLMKNLKMNYSKVDDLTVETIQHYRSGADVALHLFIMKKDEKRVRAILAKWADRGFIGNLTIPDKEFVLRPLLDLQSVSINQAGVIRQNDEFILSCVARGSPSMSFRWFKDGHFVNATGNYNHKWTRLIKDPHLDDQYTSILGVERANFLDSGTFTCQIENGRVQQCLSRRVTVRTPPIIKIEPMSLTVKRGENFTIKCFSMGDSSKKYTYSWTKNKELIPVRTNSEKYEILYPGGSILQVFHIEKSVKYSCLVQDEAVSGEVEVDVHVIDREGVRTCSRHQYLGTVWSETAPDTDSIQECPKGFAFPGFARRSCTLKDGHRPVWQLPDYSQCGSESIVKLERKIQLLHLGYETTTPANAIQNCLKYLKIKSNLYPGEGARTLVLIQNIIKLKNALFDALNHTKLVFETIDRILQHNNSLTAPEHVKLLQQVVNQQVEISGSKLMGTHFPLQLSFSSIDVGLMLMNGHQFHINIPYSKAGIHNWIPLKAKIKLKNEEENPTSRPIFAAVVYRNLSLFLPPRSVIRLRDGAEAEYEIISHIVRLWTASNQTDYWKIAQVLLEFKNNGNQAFRGDEGWYVRCALTDILTNLWNFTACVTEIPNATIVTCNCPQSGTFAMLAIKNYVQVEKDGPEPSGHIVLVGCSICFILSLICSILLTVHWFLKKSCVTFLKLQCSLSVLGIMITFIFCTLEDPIEDIFASITAVIEILALMGMTAHISTLLIIYTELVDLPKTSSKQTIIGISTGVPVITVFGNHLAQRTMNVRVPSWWLLFGTMAFYIFVTVTVVIILLFLLLCFTIINKLKKLSTVYEKDEEFMGKRLMLLRRSACIFTFLVIAVGGSVSYINFLEIIWCHYVYCATVIALGLTLIICNVIKSEINYSEWFKRRIKPKPKPKTFFGIESNANPLSFYTKEDAEVESESIPHQRKPLKKRECCPLSETYKSALPECVAGTMETFVCTEKAFCETPQLEDIESYNRSPRQGRKVTASKKDTDPDIIASKMYTKLDLVISHAPVKIDDKEITTPVKQETTTTAPLSLSEVVERSQPDGREKILNISEKVFLEKVQVNNTDNMDGMLDKISQDLDYLLNDRVEPCTIIKHGTIRRSKPPSPIAEIEELEEIEDET